MPGDPSQLHIKSDEGPHTLCELATQFTQWTEHPEKATCLLCRGIIKPADQYRRVDFHVGGETGAYVTVYQRPGEAPMLDLNFYDGDRSMDEAMLRAQTLMLAHELASHWHAQTRASTLSPGPSAAL